MSDDASYYAELVLGAEYAADQAVDAAERTEHLRMARVYGVRAEEAGGAPVRTYH